MADFATSNHAAVQKQLDRINALSPGRDILGLERIAALMSTLDNPHQKLPPVFHVAGTNGKGSTCAFLRSAIEAAGKSVHVYTSPHLVRFNERIRIAGTLISDDYLADILSETLDAAEKNSLNPSFFEVTTAAAFLAFSRNPADACIVEVGLGGRLDATNIIEKPAVCGIANLGIDHEGFLLSAEDGTPDDPMTRIAWEKAGIAKSNTPLIAGHYSNSMNDSIAVQADKVGASLSVKKREWDAAAYKDHIYYKDEKGKITLPLPRMNGAHQIDNAALAIAMLRHQNKIDIPTSAMAAAMEWTHWPARLQLLSAGPIQAIQPNVDIWLDGGHNANAGEAIAQHFGDIDHIHLIIGMLSNKDPAAIIEPLADKIKSITILPIKGHEYHDINAFKGALELSSQSISICEQDSAQEALKSLGDDNQHPILITGSLYLAGEILAANEQYPD